MNEPFWKLFNAGTSEGVRKAWETRKGGHASGDWSSFAEGEGERNPDWRDHVQQGFAHQEAGRDAHADKSFQIAKDLHQRDHPNGDWHRDVEAEGEALPSARDHLQHAFAHAQADDASREDVSSRRAIAMFHRGYRAR